MSVYPNAALNDIQCDQGYAIATVNNPDFTGGFAIWRDDNGNWETLTVQASAEDVEDQVPEDFPKDLLEKWKEGRVTLEEPDAQPARADCTPTALTDTLTQSGYPTATAKLPVVCGGEVAVGAVDNPPEFTDGVGFFVATDQGWTLSRVSPSSNVTTSGTFQDTYDDWKQKLAQTSTSSTTVTSAP